MSGLQLGSKVALSTFHQDLQTLGRRERRHYDTRRSFISLGLCDGASEDLLRWVTHAPGDVFDAYTLTAMELALPRSS